MIVLKGDHYVLCVIWGVGYGLFFFCPLALATSGEGGVVLVLGGGGSRALSEVGVLQVLEGAHIPIDRIIGTSAGSMVGAIYANDPNAVHLKKIIYRVKKKQLLGWSYQRFWEGFVNASGIESFIEAAIHGHHFRQLKIPFVAVATDVETGEAKAFSSGSVGRAVSASSALPPTFQPVAIQGRLYMDGGASELVPVATAKNYHPRLMIVVAVARQAPALRKLYFWRLAERYMLFKDLALQRLAISQADVAISPQVGDVGVFDNTHKVELFYAGVRAAQAALPKILRLMHERGIPLNNAKDDGGTSGGNDASGASADNV